MVKVIQASESTVKWQIKIGGLFKLLKSLLLTQRFLTDSITINVRQKKYGTKRYLNHSSHDMGFL